MTLLVLGLAAWIATTVIVESEIFRDVREAIDRLHDRKNNWFTYKLRYLSGCHLCAGIWVAAIIAFFVTPFASSGFVGWGITALAIKGAAHLFLVIQKWAESKTDLNKSDVALNDVKAVDYSGTQNYTQSTGTGYPSDDTAGALHNCLSHWAPSREKENW